MGFLDGLFNMFKRGLTTQQELEIKRRMALRRAQQQINKLNAKSTELTTEYSKLWEEAKQYLKAGDMDMAERTVRRCRMLKAWIAQYEKRSADAAAQLAKIGSVATTGTCPTRLEDLVGSVDFFCEGDEIATETAFGEPFEDMAELMRALEQEVEMEMREEAARHLEAGQTEMAEQVLREWLQIKVRIDEYYQRESGDAPGDVEQWARQAEPRHDAADMLESGSARLKKLMEEFK